MTEPLHDDAAAIIKATTVEPPVDQIHVEREIGRTRASVTLTSDVKVIGQWAAGDSQAFRRLIYALMEVADSATARVDRSQRLISDQAVGLRQLRDQLNIAAGTVDKLRDQREQVQAEGAHRIGELLAEITQLKADLAKAQTTPTMTPQNAEVARIVRKQDQLRGALTVERRRADAATASMRDMADRLAAAEERANGAVQTTSDFYAKAVDAACAADKAFEEASWKEGERYLKLANMWTNLLGVVPPSLEQEIR